MASYFRDQGAFDDEGVFLVDGSYLFVPDNPNYEGSSKLRFDEAQPSGEQEGIRRAVGHGDGRGRGFGAATAPCSCCIWAQADTIYPFAGLAVMAGKDAELPKLRSLVDGFVAAAGKGVMKTAVFDRGFIDGPTISHLKTDQGVDSVFPLKAGMLDLLDARVLAEADGEPWITWRPPAGPSHPSRPSVRSGSAAGSGPGSRPSSG